MANRKHIDNFWRWLKNIKTWQLVVLLVLVSFIAATFLRLNNIGMEQRRDALVAVDKTGDEAQIMARLGDLRDYVSAHMNTDLGHGVPLQASYDRAVEAARQTALSTTGAVGNIYKLADEYCKPQFSAYSTAYLNCFIGQLSKYPSDAIDSNQQIKWPDANLYMYNFFSPVWSPDLAGWTVLLALVLLIVIVVRIISAIILRIILRIRYRNA